MKFRRTESGRNLNDPPLSSRDRVAGRLGKRGSGEPVQFKSGQPRDANPHRAENGTTGRLKCLCVRLNLNNLISRVPRVHLRSMFHCSSISPPSHQPSFRFPTFFILTSILPFTPASIFIHLFVRWIAAFLLIFLNRDLNWNERVSVGSSWLLYLIR